MRTSLNGFVDNVEKDDVRAAFEGKIKGLEAQLAENPKVKEELAQAYLEYAFLSEDTTLLYYAYKAIELDPDITVMPNASVFKEYKMCFAASTEAAVSGQMLNRFYIERCPGELVILNECLNSIKDEAKENPLLIKTTELTQKLMERGECPDPIMYKRGLSCMSEEELEKAQERLNKEEIGVGTFLSEMLLDKRMEEKAQERWAKGKVLEKPSLEKLSKIYSSEYPQHVIINPEYLGGIRFKPGDKRYAAIDDASSRICTSIAKRLPKRLDVYSFDQDGYAEEEIELEGFGKVKVAVSTNSGAFYEINSVESDEFKIFNCRTTGRVYMNLLNDTSLPMEIELKKLGLRITLFGDNSGLFANLDGLEYVDRFFNRSGVLVPDESDYKTDKERMAKRRADFPKTLLWNNTSRLVAESLNEILKRINETPEAENQITARSMGKSFPSKFGPLYTWIELKDAEKLEITNYDDTKVYPHERTAVHLGYRLVSLGIGGEYPKEANDGFIWSGFGEVKPGSDFEKFIIPGFSFSCFKDKYKLVQINPKNGEAVYVVDYKVWDDFRAKAFKTTNRLSDEQFNEMHRVLARTLVPLDEYKNNYKKPVVLIGRRLGFDEVRVVPGVVYDSQEYSDRCCKRYLKQQKNPVNKLKNWLRKKKC